MKLIARVTLSWKLLADRPKDQWSWCASVHLSYSYLTSIVLITFTLTIYSVEGMNIVADVPICDNTGYSKCFKTVYLLRQGKSSSFRIFRTWVFEPATSTTIFFNKSVMILINFYVTHNVSSYITSWIENGSIT